MSKSRSLRCVLLLCLLAQTLVVTPTVFAADPANDAFDRTWARTDDPVASGAAVRTWMWGPEPFTGGMAEPYLESPGMEREVQYFDKSRMEITDPGAEDDGIWYVTNGLLATELITGRMQIGHDAFLQLDPAAVNVAGDPDDPTGPTYATFSGLLDEDSTEPGTSYTWRVDRNTNIVEDPSLASRNVVAGEYDDVTGHTIAEPFWAFMNSSGLVLEGGQLTTTTLFQNPYFAVGRPITEAYWAEVQVAGTAQDVLMQCFERRCLTYTPDNDPAWQVEAGNVGLHYFAWRYESGQQYTIEQVIVAEGGTVPLGDASLEIPAGVLEDDTLAAISIHAQPPAYPEGYVPVGPLFDVNVGGVGLDGQVTLSLPFTVDAFPDGVEAGDLVAGRWDGTAWHLVPGTARAGSFTVTTDTLSFWQVLSPASGDVDPPSPPQPSPPLPSPTSPPGPGPDPTPTPTPTPTPPATATPTSTPEPDGMPPVAEGQHVDPTGGVPVEITLVASDDDSPALTFEIVGGPEHGALDTTSPGATCVSDGEGVTCSAVVTYTADFGYNGADDFTFVADDGELTSQPAMVSIDVTSASLAQSTIEADPDTLVANGADSATITVTLFDEDGNPLGVSGGMVVLEASTGTIGTVTDHGDGSYTATYTAPTTAGSATITGTLNGQLLGDTATIALTAGPATVIEKVSGDEEPATVGTQRELQVRVVDAFGNPVAGFTVEWELGSEDFGLLSDDETLADASGIASVTWTAGTAAGEQVVTASADGLSGSPVTFTVEVIAGAPDRLVIITQPSEEAHNAQPLDRQPVIQVQDQYGNLVGAAGDGLVVTASIASGGGTLTNAQATTSEGGIATFSGLTITGAAGPRTLSFSVSGLTGATSDTIEVVAGDPASIVIHAGDNQTAAVGNPVATPPAVEVRDVSGNPVQDVAVTFSVVDGGGSVTGSPATTGADGVAAVDSWTLGGTASVNTLSASLAGYPDAGSVSFTATGEAGAASTIQIVSGDESPDTVATSRTLEVRVTDAFNNVKSGEQVSWQITAGDGSLSGSTSTTDGDGIASIEWTLGETAGVQSVEASIGVADVTFTVTAEPDEPDPTRSTISVDPATLVVGSDQTATVTVALLDQYGNSVTASGGTVIISTDLGVISGTTDNTDGTYTATLSPGTDIGTATLSAMLDDENISDTATVEIIGGTLAGFLVEAAAGGDIPDQLAGTPFNIRVTAVDDFGNTVTGFTGTVELTTTPAGGLSAGATTGAFTAGVLNSHSVTFGAPGTFTITATNGDVSSTSDEFMIQAPPTAMNDGPAANSAPGDAFHTPLNTSLETGGTTPNLLANDNRGMPFAQISSFGADDLGGSVTSYAAGSTVSLPGYADGSLTVNTDGSISFEPPTGFTGMFEFRYRLQNVRGTSDARVTIAVGERIAAQDEMFAPDGTILGNVSFDTANSSGFSVLANETGDGLTLSQDITDEVGGTFTLNTETGTFEYQPEAGFSGEAGFTYSISNGFGTETATVSFTVSSSRIWFVDDAATDGDGTLASPFNCLVGPDCLSGSMDAGDAIFLYSGTYAGGLSLPDNVSLIGQGATEPVASITGWAPIADATLPSTGGAAPVITTVDSPISGLYVGRDNLLRGFDIATTTGFGLGGGGFGTLTVSEVSITGSSEALSLAIGSLSGSFNEITSTGGATNITLLEVQTSGTFDLGTGSLSGATGDALRIGGQDGSFTYSGTISNSSSFAVNISSKTGGTVTLSGDINPGSAGRGIILADNHGTTVIFSGSQKMIGTAENAGVDLYNNSGSTIRFTGGGLQITTTTGSGFLTTNGGTVEVSGAGNTIISNGGTALDLQGMTVAGAGLTFDAISATGGVHGVSLVETSGGTVTINGGTIAGTASHGVSLSNSASVEIDGLTVYGSGEDDIHLMQSTGTMTLAINDSDIGSFDTWANGVVIDAHGVANVSVNITGSRFHDLFGSGYLTTMSESANLTSTLTGNDMGMVFEGISIGVGGSRHDFTITGNTIVDALIAGISVISGSETTSSTGATGTIEDNDIGPGVAIGISVNTGGGTQMSVAVRNNRIYSPAMYGILAAGDGDGMSNLTIHNNFVSNSGASQLNHAIRIESHAPHSTCLAITENDVQGTSVSDIILYKIGLGSFVVHGYNQGQHGAVQSYISSTNAGLSVTVSGNGYTGGICAAP